MLSDVPKKRKVELNNGNDDNNDDNNNVNKKSKSTRELLLPVTVLGGFLGAGKTSLLKHILETKHNNDTTALFKCAVIVNDVAELNIDKKFIDQSAMVQSDDVISMQNGCVCCTLQGDLVNQITAMATDEIANYNYMIIEASGISEPAAIAQLFEDCKKGKKEDGKLSLNEVSRLDTCVTVVDAAEFLTNLNTVIPGEHNETWSKLLVEQIEYANVVLLNKIDLVPTSEELDKIRDHVMALKHPKAKLLKAKHSAIDDIMQVIDTKLYNKSDFDNNFVPPIMEYEEKACCKASVLRKEPPCCKRARTITTKVSQVLLTSKRLPTTRHESRFGISSFVYKATRPFHSERFHENFVNKYFCFMDTEDEDEHEEPEEETTKEGGKDTDVAIIMSTEKEGDDTTNAKYDREKALKELQEEAKVKQTLRNETIGMVLRSKGFCWTVHLHDRMVVYGQTGNNVHMELGDPWKVLDRRAWTGEGSSKEDIALFRKDFVDPHGDRRQEMVFIGHDMKHETIQKELDECLLTDDEFAMGLDGWKATIGDLFPVED